jgi:beta-lactamase regulating signal transducer with metallopeptidase domain
MIDFLIKSTISMALLLAVYHLFLEREKMHGFNRFYLLFALAFSLALPFITFTIYKEVVSGQQPVLDKNINFIAPVTQIVKPIDYTTPALWLVYAAITLMLAVKFATNLYYFKKQVSKSQLQKLGDATLVLLDDKVIPHTFLNYIFISKDEYEHNGIEQELYTHELAHVKQKHSFDILFIEVLKTIMWFNPLLYFYKKAIQLNHEFLADESVVATTRNVISYQQLLLQKALPPANSQLASSLNFSITKKRFTMMTKTTTKSKAVLLQLSALPVLLLLVFSLSTEVIAQTAATKKPKIEAKTAEMIPNNGATDPKRDSYYKGVQVVIHDESGKKIIDKPYEQLTEAEKDKHMAPIPQLRDRRILSAKLFEDLKDNKKYYVTIDNKPVDKNQLDNFKPEDFADYFNVPGFTDAKTGESVSPQYMLLTENFYKENLEHSKKYEYSSYVVYVGFDISKAKDGGKH